MNEDDYYERPYRKDRLFKAIVEYINEKSYPPSVRELTRLINVNSTSTVHSYLLQLQRDGKIIWEPRTSRTLRVVKQDQEVLNGS
jgi:repressor LexA